MAIVTTSGRLDALERLTADKRVLRAAVDKFRSLPSRRPSVGDNDFTCAWHSYKADGGGSGIQDEDGWLASAPCFGCPKELDPQLELQNDHRSAYYSLLSVAALRRVIDGLRELPGRRSILTIHCRSPWSTRTRWASAEWPAGRPISKSSSSLHLDQVSATKPDELPRY